MLNKTILKKRFSCTCSFKGYLPVEDDHDFAHCHSSRVFNHRVSAVV